MEVANPVSLISEDLAAAIQELADSHAAIQPNQGCAECFPVGHALVGSIPALNRALLFKLPILSDGMMSSQPVCDEVILLIVCSLVIGAKAQQIADRRKVETAELTRLAALEAR